VAGCSIEPGFGTPGLASAAVLAGFVVVGLAATGSDAGELPLHPVREHAVRSDRAAAARRPLTRVTGPG
jgi:hypothetical protein